ncbi:unnamed protein product [Linum trigynum]|uniref:Uncharacterized protein n=1 Tax=Linum trigynum TaxID=586398 RepID=A0AAV2GAG1_9ROSI
MKRELRDRIKDPSFPITIHAIKDLFAKTMSNPAITAPPSTSKGIDETMTDTGGDNTATESREQSCTQNTNRRLRPLSILNPPNISFPVSISMSICPSSKILSWKLANNT